jgi:hypothetical protein
MLLKDDLSESLGMILISSKFEKDHSIYRMLLILEESEIRDLV